MGSGAGSGTTPAGDGTEGKVQDQRGVLRGAERGRTDLGGVWAVEAEAGRAVEVHVHHPRLEHEVQPLPAPNGQR